ncbi:hypothetical protein JX265_011742 [Neoarthrinium moseri]|uniref:Uncharacterized protein n=1 Tax=Neoarthrinium moseri TaxID=1658444 RepID=A0A9P9WC10_9PEZI|nr:hypothetical protein JX265_011742 [Neoarthrinium moseri]
MHLVTKRLHEQYGPIVRIGPNHLDLDCPSLIKTCLDRNGLWRKTEFYAVSGVLHEGKVAYNIFSETNSAEHARIKKPIAKYYSMNGVLTLQPHIDNVLGHFVRQIDARFVGTGEEMGPAFDFGQWVLYLGWDMVGKVTYGKRVGYLDKGYDFDGTLNVEDKAMDYLVTVGMQPGLDKFLDKNRLYRIGPPSFGSLVAISLQHLIRRYDGSDKHDPAKPDFMDRYIEAKAEHPDIVDDQRLLSYLLANMAAGADTTALTLRSVFYLSLKHPSVWARLQAEVLAAPFARKKTMDLPASFADARALPYLEAVVREALRLYPGNCFPMERYVPAGGVTLPDGSFVGEGAAVGFNAYVLHRNAGVWGADAEAFRPERWLRDEAAGEGEDAFRRRLTDMNNCDLSFGAGQRKCIGMNLGMMQVYKTVATLVALYEFELADPEREWRIHNSIFPRQSGVEFRMRKREGVVVRGGLDLYD